MALFSTTPRPEDIDWRWPHFSPHELACKCGVNCRGAYFHDPLFLDGLEAIRAQIGPLRVNSGHRCRRHNKAVGGTPRSYHTRFIAADLAIPPKARARLAHAAVEAGFTGLGFGRNFLHVDRGPSRAWTYPGALGLWIRALGFDPIREPIKRIPPKKAALRVPSPEM